MDIRVAHHKDDHLLYFLLYFIELKMPKSKLDTSENCGQLLDYFNAIYKKQPHRSEFVPTLKNPGSTPQTILSTALLSLGNAHVNLWMQLSSLMNYQKLNTRTKFWSLKIGLDLSTMFLPYRNSTSCFRCQNLKWCRFKDARVNIELKAVWWVTIHGIILLSIHLFREAVLSWRLGKDQIQ